MKLFKRLTCLLLAASLVLAPCLTSMAVDDDTTETTSSGNSTDDAGNGSITVNNYDSDVTYKAYRIFDISYSTYTDDDNEVVKTYAYTLSTDSPWYEYLSGNAEKLGLTLTQTASDSGVYNVSVNDDFSAASFAYALKEQLMQDADLWYSAQHGDWCVELTNGSATGMTLGYYLIVGWLEDEDADTEYKNLTEYTDETTGVTVKTLALAELTSTDPDAVVNEKSEVVFNKSYTVTSEDEAVTDENGETIVYDADAESDDGDDESSSRASVQIGDVLTFTIEGKVPDATGFDKFYTYVISDTLSTGLTLYPDTMTVTIGDGDDAITFIIDGKSYKDEGGTAYNVVTITSDDGTETNVYIVTYEYEDYNLVGDGSTANFTLTFDILSLIAYYGEDIIGETITVTYDAVVNDSASATVIGNEAELKVTNDPDVEGSYSSYYDEEEAYSSKISIYKGQGTESYTYEDEDDNEVTVEAEDGEYLADPSVPLGDAVFVLYRYVDTTDLSDDELDEYDTVEVDGKTKYIEYYCYHAEETTTSTDEDGNEVSETTDAYISWEKTYILYTTDEDGNEVAATDKDGNPLYVTGMYFVTDSDGEVTIEGLKEGTYYLREIEAPDGYNLLESDTEIVIEATNAEDSDGNETDEISEASLTVSVDVPNITGSLLPSTGGIGTTVFYIGGIILILAAGAFVLIRRRREEDQI